MNKVPPAPRIEIPQTLEELEGYANYVMHAAVHTRTKLFNLEAPLPQVIIEDLWAITSGIHGIVDALQIMRQWGAGKNTPQVELTRYFQEIEFALYRLNLLCEHYGVPQYQVLSAD